MEKKTASAEQSMPKIPLSAQYHGISFFCICLTSRMPVGKKKPISNPSGNIAKIDATIFRETGEVIIFEISIVRRVGIIIMSMAVDKGYTYTHGSRSRGRRSLK